MHIGIILVFILAFILRSRNNPYRNGRSSSFTCRFTAISVCNCKHIYDRRLHRRPRQKTPHLPPSSPSPLLAFPLSLHPPPPPSNSPPFLPPLPPPLCGRNVRSRFLYISSTPTIVRNVLQSFNYKRDLES